MTRYTISEIEAFVQRFYPGRKLLLTPYGYPMQFDPITHATNATQQLQISANADFLLLGIGYHADLAGAAQAAATKPSFVGRILITDTGSNEQFTQGAVDLETYAENNVAGVNLPYPRIVGGRSVLQVQLFSDEAANDYTVNLNFIGVLIRAYSGT
jgi:hypothetical protein